MVVNSHEFITNSQSRSLENIPYEIAIANSHEFIMNSQSRSLENIPYEIAIVNSHEFIMNSQSRSLENIPYEIAIARQNKVVWGEAFVSPNVSHQTGTGTRGSFQKRLILYRYSATVSVQ
jgi:hypothetical protein